MYYHKRFICKFLHNLLPTDTEFTFTAKIKITIAQHVNHPMKTVYTFSAVLRANNGEKTLGPPSSNLPQKPQHTQLY
jgi:hypothetical protein